MRRIRRASKHQLHGFIQEAVEPDSTIHTDSWEGYVGLEALGYQDGTNTTFWQLPANQPLSCCLVFTVWLPC